MILHGHPTADLWHGNTLSTPYFKNPDDSLQTFDFAVVNPPFSDKAWSNGLDPKNDPLPHEGHVSWVAGFPFSWLCSLGGGIYLQCTDVTRITHNNDNSRSKNGKGLK